MPKPKIPKDSQMNQVDTRFDPVATALRRMHEAVTAEPVPDDFLKLLDQIDAKITAAKKLQ